MLNLEEFVRGLGFVLAIDNCARKCLHCPAFGSTEPVRRASLAALEARLAEVSRVRHSLELGGYENVVHCWRISDPLDYAHRLPGGGVATCADVARLWRTVPACHLTVAEHRYHRAAPAEGLHGAIRAFLARWSSFTPRHDDQAHAELRMLYRRLASKMDPSKDEPTSSGTRRSPSGRKRRMIHDNQGQAVDTWTAPQRVVEALDQRFPDHNQVFARVTRLAEEAGELAGAVNHAEGVGVKKSKHGDFTPEQLVKEIEDVLRAAMGIAHHYGVEEAVERFIERHYRMNQQNGYIPSAPTTA